MLLQSLRVSGFKDFRPKIRDLQSYRMTKFFGYRVECYSVYMFQGYGVVEMLQDHRVTKLQDIRVC